jgi:serine/threonine protein kinase
MEFAMAGKLLVSPGEEATEKVRFGNFEVMNDPEGRPVLLGKGTFGRTYQARHCFLDTIVALKIITERYVADATVRQRFLTEARAVAKLSHPHIARLYDFGEMDGVLHYAMEYCGGGSLADHVAKNGPMPLRRTIEIAQQISGALKCAHTAGFIHRDLKPSNIMLTTPDGPPFAKLIDFGLVQPSVPGATRSFADDQSADGARFLGTPLFASPEQLREEPMDVRTDLFSLGMTLWFLTEGRAPEGGSSAEIAASRLNRESYAARLPADLPLPFRDVLGRLLEKDRKNRFATAADVFTALNACAAALGFRRARDYTDPAAAIEWEDAETPDKEVLDSTKIEAIEIEEVNAPLTSEFNIVTRVNEDFTGLNYVGETIGGKGTMSILHVLHPMLLEDESALKSFRLHIAQLMRVDVVEIMRPKAIKRYADYTAVISDKPSGSDLLSVLRIEGTVRLIDAAPLLEKIADACDQLCAAGLPGAQLSPGRIFVESANDGLSKAQVRLCPRYLAVGEAPELARMNEPEDVSSTMTTDMLGDPGRADNMGEHFASLLYRVVAGRNCPVAASLAGQGYVAVPGLSEQSNRILSMIIARQVEDSSCGKVLREILNAEGIVPRVPGHSSEGFTQRPGSSTVSPLATPPASPVDRTPATPRPWKPPTVSTPAPIPVVARPVPPPVPVTPLPTPVVVKPPASPPTHVPAVSPKEPAPVVSEVKVESKRVIETPVPVVPEVKVESKPMIETPMTPATTLPVSKAPAPEIVSEPAARPKDVPATPIQEEKQKTVREPEKRAAFVSPKVAETREEKKAVAKAPVSPPPAEKAALVMPKVMPAPTVPVTPRRSADVEEQPQVWDARKLKPIGIGIAALLAISLSYVGVKTLTKSVPKSPEVRRANRPNAMLVEKSSPPAKEQIATASETTPPQIATAAQPVAPPVTNSPTEPATTQNPATEPGAAQNVASLNQGATAPAAAAPKPDVATQSAARTQPGPPQIAAKQPENPSSASGRTRSGDGGSRSASSGQTAAKSSGASRSTARSSAASNAPPPAPPRPAARAPAPPKAPSETRQRHRSEFEGGAPGG